MNPIKTTGFHQAGSVTPGTVIESVYFAVPGQATIGDHFETFEAALVEAIARRQKHVDDHNARNLGYPHPERVDVDCRWVLRNPLTPTGRPNGSTDTVAERTTYDTLDEARSHLALIEKYRPVGAR